MAPMTHARLGPRRLAPSALVLAAVLASLPTALVGATSYRDHLESAGFGIDEDVTPLPEWRCFDTESTKPLLNVTLKGLFPSPVLIASAHWETSRLLAVVLTIILREELGYATEIVRGPRSSEQLLRASAGCPEPFNVEKRCPTMRSGWVHASTEIWSTYSNPGNHEGKPPVTNQEYVGVEGIYVPRKNTELAWEAEALPLRYYQAYDGRLAPRTSRFFPNMTALLAAVAVSGGVNASCLGHSDSPYSHFDEATAEYQILTGDAEGVDDEDGLPKCTPEGWWLSPACRREPESCIPSLTQNSVGMRALMHASYFLNLSLALANLVFPPCDTCDDGEQFESLYRSLQQEGVATPIFYYWPNVLVTDTDMLQLPPHNKEEWVMGKMASMGDEVPLGIGLSPDLQSVDRRVFEFLSKSALRQQGIDTIVKAFYDDADSPKRRRRFDAACTWLKKSPKSWRPWTVFEGCPAGSYSDTVNGEDGCSECPPGHVSAALASKCTPCEPGHASNAARSECEGCPVGTFAAEVGSPRCDPCPVGTACPAPALSAPVPCGEDEYTDEEGAFLCKSCTLTLPGSSTYGEVGIATPAGCLLCPPRGRCDGATVREAVRLSNAHAAAPSTCSVARVNSSAGFARYPPDTCVAAADGTCPECPLVDYACQGCASNKLDLRCKNEAACPADVPLATALSTGGCAEGYRGVQCTACSPGFARVDSTTCIKCHGSHALNVLFFCLTLLFVGSVLFALVAHKIRNAGSRDSASMLVVKVLLSHLQVLGVLASLSLDWPPSLLGMFAATDVASASWYSGISVSCALRPWAASLGIEVFFLEALIAATLPLIVVVICALYLRALQRHRRNNPHSPQITDEQRGVLLSASVTIVIFYLYSGVNRVGFELLSCTSPLYSEADGSERRFLMRDTTIECWNGTHILWAALLGGPIVVLFTLGVPLHVGLSLRAMRRLPGGLKSRAESHGFLFLEYEDRVYFYESVVYLRKAVIAACSVCLNFTSPEVQLLTMLLVLMIFFAVAALVAPFIDYTLDLLEAGSLMVLFVTTVSGAYMQQASTDGEKMAATLAAWACNAVFLVACFGVAVKLRSNTELFSSMKSMVDNALHGARAGMGGGGNGGAIEREEAMSFKGKGSGTDEATDDVSALGDKRETAGLNLPDMISANDEEEPNKLVRYMTSNGAVIFDLERTEGFQGHRKLEMI